MNISVTDALWSDDISILWNVDRLIEFWPSNEHSYNEKVNALTRFILYSAGLCTVVKNDSMCIIYGIALVVIISLLAKSAVDERSKSHGALKTWFPKFTAAIQQQCQAPTKRNPFANVMIGDKGEKLPACAADEVKEVTERLFNEDLPNDPTDPYQRNTGSRQFFSTANTQVPNDQESFAKWCYDPGKNCKSYPDACTV